MTAHKKKIHIDNGDKAESDSAPPEVKKDKKTKQTTLDTCFDDTFQDNNQNENPSNLSSISEGGCCKSHISLVGHSIVNDVKQTIGKHWVGEMLNFNQKTLAVSFFLFFAAIVSVYSLLSSLVFVVRTRIYFALLYFG
jgi:hypothetical protein